MEFPCLSHRNQHRTTGGLGLGNISYHDITYIARGRLRDQIPHKGTRLPQHRMQTAPSPVHFCLLTGMTNLETRYSRREPERVDSKTMWRPSGAQLGRSLRPASRVNSTIWRDAGSIT